MMYDLTGLSMSLYSTISADYHARKDAGQKITMWDMPPTQLLCTNNTKSNKTLARGVLTGIMYLSPADTVSGQDATTLCPWAKQAGCAAGCLNTAGRGKYHTVQLARIRKTLYFHQFRHEFVQLLDIEIRRVARTAEALGLKPAIRLNGTSDIPWHHVAERHPSVQFYDYTKVINWAQRDRPDNYHITLSYSGASPDYALRCLNYLNSHEENHHDKEAEQHKPEGNQQAKTAMRQKQLHASSTIGNSVDYSGLGAIYSSGHSGVSTVRGSNMAVVFRDAETVRTVREQGWTIKIQVYGVNEEKYIPPERIIDGDAHDARFLDPGPGYVVALTAKGRAKEDTSGFVVDI